MFHIYHHFLKVLLGGASILTLLAGCASNNLPTASPAPAATIEQTEYLIGPGDTLNISVWRNPAVSTPVDVRPDGKITISLVEDLPAAGKSPNQLARDLEKALSHFIQDPIVTVMVTNFVGPYSQQIRVIGQAAKPQALPYRQGMSLMDVVIEVGGMTEFAAGNRASIIREVEGQKVKMPARLDDLIKKGDVSVNFPVRPGDILVIPESWF